jgi:hypothetical protein
MNFAHTSNDRFARAAMRYTAILFLLGCFLAQHANAFIFTIDPLSSSLSLSGTVAGFTLTQQGPGSLTTTYSGSINADFNSSTIQFNNAAAAAAINGNWQPLPGGGSGSAPANYGGQASLGGFGIAFGAGRNIVLDITSGVIPLSGTSFDASQLSISPTTGALDYNSPFGSGSTSLAGLFGANMATMGDISVVGGIATLTIPVQITQVLTLVSNGDTTITLSGNLVATAAVPEASTFQFVLVGALLFAGGLWFKRRNSLAC